MQSNLNVDISQFSDLVDCIYQGATDVNVWPTITKNICDWLGAKTCVIFTPEFSTEQGGFAIMHQFNGMGLYDAKFNAHNIWEMRAYEGGLLTTVRVIRDQVLVSEQELLDSIIYKEYMESMGLGCMIAGISPPSDNDGNAIVCTCHKPLDSPFTQGETEKLKLLMPHLSRTLGVMFKLRDAKFRVANSMHALNCLSHGVILFNTLGQVCHANDCAKALLNLKDGLQLNSLSTTSTWQLKASTAKEQALLDAAISVAISHDVLSNRHFTHAINVQRPTGKTPFMLSFSTLGELHDFSIPTGQPCAIAFVYDPSKPITLNNQLLKNTCGLSKVELKVASHLVNGFSIEHAAAELNLSANTIKTHLKQIHYKTNSRNRAQLVKFLMQLNGD